jgi:hypothetical protein
VLELDALPMRGLRRAVGERRRGEGADAHGDDYDWRNES